MSLYFSGALDFIYVGPSSDHRFCVFLYQSLFFAFLLLFFILQSELPLSIVNPDRMLSRTICSVNSFVSNRKPSTQTGSANPDEMPCSAVADLGIHCLIWSKHKWSHAMLIMQTCPCNENPLTPHFYIVKLGCTGVYIFYFCSKT